MIRIASRDLNWLTGLKSATKELSPAYFAMVMATGIVSIAAFMLGMVSVAVILFAVNITAYLVLGLLTILRLVWFPRAFLSDLWITNADRASSLSSLAHVCSAANSYLLQYLRCGARFVGSGDHSVDNFDLRHFCRPVRQAN